jgi:hypothetical protein
MAEREYDSTRIREAAQAMKGLSDELEGNVMGLGRRAEETAGQLKGRGPTALGERLSELSREIGHISAALEALDRDLIRYAGVLEETSESLKTEMERR